MNDEMQEFNRKVGNPPSIDRVPTQILIDAAESARRYLNQPSIDNKNAMDAAVLRVVQAEQTPIEESEVAAAKILPFRGGHLRGRIRRIVVMGGIAATIAILFLLPTLSTTLISFLDRSAPTNEVIVDSSGQGTRTEQVVSDSSTDLDAQSNPCNTFEVCLMQAQGYYDLEMYQTAINIFSVLIDLDPDYIESYNLRGRAYNERTEYEFALADLRIYQEKYEQMNGSSPPGIDELIEEIQDKIDPGGQE